MIDFKNLPPVTDDAAWKAMALETLHAMQLQHELFFADVAACLQPDASHKLAQGLVPKAIFLTAQCLELTSLADAVAKIILNTAQGSENK